MNPDSNIEYPASSIQHRASSIETTIYEVIPILVPGYRLPALNINNGTDWLREAVNTIYNRNKGRLKATGVVTNLFHNHNEQNGQNIARYPLIQYQRSKKGYFVTGLNEGCLALDELFCDTLPEYTITDGLHLKIQKVLTKNYPVIAHSSKQYSYSLINWLPFSSENFRRYKTMELLTDKLAFLENTLKSHIVKDFSKHLELGLTDVEVQIKLTGIDNFNNSTVRLKVNKHIHDFQPFTVGFTTNVELPHNICLGNGKAYGFGLIEEN